MAESARNLEPKTGTEPMRQSITAPLAGRRHPLEAMRGEIDRLFEDFTRGFPFLPALHRARDWEQAVLPAIDLAERDGAYEITAELPGLDEKDVEVTLADGVLTIKGEKSEAREDSEKDYHLSERRYGAFRRAFDLSANVDESKVTAAFAKGVLTVTLPKSAEARQRQKKIAITSK